MTPSLSGSQGADTHCTTAASHRSQGADDATGDAQPTQDSHGGDEFAVLLADSGLQAQLFRVEVAFHPSPGLIVDLAVAA